jgi:serine/threonine-protein kinase
LLPEFNQNEEAFERFVREAKTTGTLQHSSIVDVYDVALTPDGNPFIVMELLNGEELETLIERTGAVSPLQVAAYFAQLASALQLAHQAGVVHRDLSTNNIFLARGADGGVVPKILDFGVSKTLGPRFEGQSVTCDGAVLGNPIFMSPEQARGAREVDGRTDVWALGVGMYQSLTGTAPFRSTNYNALMVDIMTRAHRPLMEMVPTLDRELASIIEWCLKKDREQRLPSAQLLAEKLSHIARRLAVDPVEIGRTPLRRATDRLPPARASQEAMASAGLPFAVRFWHSLGLPVPSAGLMAAVAVTLSAGAGFGLGRSTQKPTPVVIQTLPAAPMMAAARPVECPSPPAQLPIQASPVKELPSKEVAKEETSGLQRAVSQGLLGSR